MWELFSNKNIISLLQNIIFDFIKIDAIRRSPNKCYKYVEGIAS